MNRSFDVHLDNIRNTAHYLSSGKITHMFLDYGIWERGNNERIDTIRTYKDCLKMVVF
jgi:hypothetical protein